jgi:prophage regulatory protein
MEHHVILKITEVTARTGLSESSIYAMAKIGSFPKQIKTGKRAAGWLERDVDEWLLDRIQASKNAEQCNGAAA